MTDPGSGLTPTAVQLAVGPIFYVIALRPDDAGQVGAAVEPTNWSREIPAPWLPTNGDGAVNMGCGGDVERPRFRRANDLTQADDNDPAPAGLQRLGLQVTRDHQ